MWAGGQDLVDAHVEISPLDFIPGAHILHYRDRLTLMLVKETYGVNETGGLGAFCYAALVEAQVCGTGPSRGQPCVRASR